MKTALSMFAQISWKVKYRSMSILDNKSQRPVLWQLAPGNKCRNFGHQAASYDGTSALNCLCKFHRLIKPGFVLAENLCISHLLFVDFFEACSIEIPYTHAFMMFVVHSSANQAIIFYWTLIRRCKNRFYCMLTLLWAKKVGEEMFPMLLCSHSLSYWSWASISPNGRVYAHWTYRPCCTMPIS